MLEILELIQRAEEAQPEKKFFFHYHGHVKSVSVFVTREDDERLFEASYYTDFRFWDCKEKYELIIEYLESQIRYRKAE